MIIVQVMARLSGPLSEPLRLRLVELGRQVRERHAGNIDYRFAEDLEDPTILRLSERWSAHADFDAHGQTDEVRAIGEALAGALVGAPQIVRYDVTPSQI